MKKLIVGVAAAAVLALPVVPASADDSVAWFGQKRCPAPYTGGTIIWHDTPVTDYQEIWLCIPGGPGMATADDSSARVGVYRCGGTGIIVWYYDLQNRYHEPVNTCL